MAPTPTPFADPGEGCAEGPAPHFLPYQGSKRRLAEKVLAFAAGRAYERIVEPFVGSGAVTLAAMHRGLVRRAVIGDSLVPLADLWRQVLDDPEAVADGYALRWTEQDDPAQAYDAIRRRFNEGQDPIDLLYLLARCVKNAPRFGRDGRFNQAADHRRLGVRPERLRRSLREVSNLMRGRAEVLASDFEPLLATATSRDLCYLDPPWQGTSDGRDRRYHAGLARDRLVDSLGLLVRRGVPFLLSYDGRCGERSYGPVLPESLGLVRWDLWAGRSAQATLSGRVEQTVESLYVSPALACKQFVPN